MLTNEQRAVALEALIPDRGRAPWRLKYLKVCERVLHLHLRTCDEPQGSLCDALSSMGSCWRIDWQALSASGRLRDVLLSTAQEIRPTLVFAQIQRGGVLDEGTLVALRQLCSEDAVIVHWSGDVTGHYAAEGEHWTRTMANGCDLMLFSCMSHVKAHRKQGMDNASYLQVGYDEDRYYPGRTGYGSRYDACFLGQRYDPSLLAKLTIGTEENALRREIGVRLRREFGHRAGVFGTGWGRSVSPAQSGDVYRSSHLAVSASIASDMERYSSDRLLRALACGGVVLCKRFDDCESWGLRDGENVVLFDDVDEMAEKAKGLLEGSRERRLQVGMAGALLASSHHSWFVRMQEMMVMVEAIRGRQVGRGRPW